MRRTPTLLSWSGGKDSSLALAALQDDPRFEVVGLITSVTREYDRISIHGVRRSLLEAQVRALGIPLFEIALEPRTTNAAYEQAFLDAIARVRLVHPTVRHIAFGDLFLEDVRAYRERLCAGAGLEPVFPIWGLDTTTLARAFVARGFLAYVVCVDTTQLDASFAGATFDERFLARLPATVDWCGERGEFHTFVSGGPTFREPVPVVRGEVVLRDDRFAYCDLLPA